MKQSSTQSFLLVDQAWFQYITERLSNLDQNVLANITEKLSNSEHFVPESDSEKACFQVLHDLDHVAGRVQLLAKNICVMKFGHLLHLLVCQVGI